MGCKYRQVRRGNPKLTNNHRKGRSPANKDRAKMEDKEAMMKYLKSLLSTIKIESFPSCEVGFTFLRLIVNSTSKSPHWDEVSIILKSF